MEEEGHLKNRHKDFTEPSRCLIIHSYATNQMKVNGYEIKPGADLRCANLEGANLEGAYLRDANLEGTNLSGANLEGADLRYANLRYANLYRANLSGANLDGANLDGANLEGANVKGTILEKKEEPSQDTTSLSEKVKELEEENKMLIPPEE